MSARFQKSPPDETSVLPSSLPRRLRPCREDGDPVAAHRANPELLPDLDGHRAGAERVAVGVANELLKLQRVRIDPRYVRRLRRGGSSLAGGEKRAIRRPPQVVNAKPDSNSVFLDRRLSS